MIRNQIFFQFNILIQQMQKLQKPHFVKLQSLENMREGYNVYVKVVEVQKQTSQNGNFQIARVIVADETASANAFFKGQNTKLIEKNKVIAIRNGRVKLIKGHISLEIDIFGRITPETKEIDANLENNISDREFTKRPRNQRPRSFKKRQYSRERRPNFKQQRSQKYKQKEKEERRPRRENGQKNTRPKIQWTKIAGIEPGEEDLNITAKVMEVQSFKNRARVLLGDETGMVKAFLFQNEHLKEGNTIVLFRCEATVVKEHIEVQLMKTGKVDLARNRNIENVDEKTNVSDKAWVQSA